MTFTEARKILGLGPDEDPRKLLSEFRNARERIAEMVRTAPNEILGDRYQEGLLEFDQALAAIREFLETPDQPASPPPAEIPARPAPADAIIETPGEEPAATPPRRSRSLSWCAWPLAFLIGVAGGGVLYYKNEENIALQRQARIALLERLGAEFIENRRWQEAARSYAEIDLLSPGSDLARLGRRSIEAGMTEEQNQFVGYWTGQAIAEFETGRLDEAEAAANRVLEKFPGEKEATAILLKVSGSRASQSHAMAIAAARKLLNERQWDAAIAAARKISATSPEDEDANAIIADATAALEKRAAFQAKAAGLLQQAKTRDQGQFDQQALDWLREAASLDPDNPEIVTLLEKMASYGRTLRVPGDFATPAEALAAARENDRIVLAEQIWKGPLVIHTTVDLQGAGSSKTLIECPAADGSAITIGPNARNVRVSGITFRHESFLAVGTTRFSAALVRGGAVTFTDCHFTDASGHGLAVIENGQAAANRCRFSGNAWNGAAAIGKNSTLEIRDSESLDNFEHGIESWDGAAVSLVNNRCEGNSRNGIHADNQSSAATIEGNHLIANREFGLVVDSAGSGTISANTARANLLGGLVIRTAAAGLPVIGNQVTLNQGPGIVLEKGLDPASYLQNSVTKNKSKEILTEADLSCRDEKATIPKAVPVSSPAHKAEQTTGSAKKPQARTP